MYDRSGSPSMEDIEAFSTTYRARLDEAEIAKFVPDNLSLEVLFQVISIWSLLRLGDITLETCIDERYSRMQTKNY